MRLRTEIALLVLLLAAALAAGTWWSGLERAVKDRVAALRAGGMLDRVELTADELALRRELLAVEGQLERDLGTERLELFRWRVLDAAERDELFDRAEPSAARMQALLATPDAREAARRGRRLLGTPTLMGHRLWPPLLLGRGRVRPGADPVEGVALALDASVLTSGENSLGWHVHLYGWLDALTGAQELARDPTIDVSRLRDAVVPRLEARREACGALGAAGYRLDGVLTSLGLSASGTAGRPQSVPPGLRGERVMELLDRFDEVAARLRGPVPVSIPGVALVGKTDDPLVLVRSRLDGIAQHDAHAAVADELARIALELAVLHRDDASWPERVSVSGPLAGVVRYERGPTEVRISARDALPPKVRGIATNYPNLVWTFPLTRDR